MMDRASSSAALLASYAKAAQARPWLRTDREGAARTFDTGATTALDLFRAAPPDAPAVLYFDATLKYDDVDRLSNALAGWLASRGVTAGDRVATIIDPFGHIWALATIQHEMTTAEFNARGNIQLVEAA